MGGKTNPNLLGSGMPRPTSHGDFEALRNLGATLLRFIVASVPDRRSRGMYVGLLKSSCRMMTNGVNE